MKTSASKDDVEHSDGQESRRTHGREREEKGVRVKDGRANLEWLEFIPKGRVIHSQEVSLTIDRLAFTRDPPAASMLLAQTNTL